MQKADILVLSDTHGAYQRLVDVVGKVDCDTVIFCGDGIREAKAAQAMFGTKRFYCVRGNCDMFSDEPALLKPLIGQRKLYITHGCEVPRSNACDSLIYNCAKAECDTLFFGHTHTPECVTKNGVFAVNPGSLCFGGTYAVVNIDGDKINCEILKI